MFRALDPATGAVFSAADAPLLDELAELLGVDDAEERERSRRRWRAQLAEAQEALDILTGSAPQDLEDDLDPEILMAYDLIDAGQLAERQNVRSHQTTAERAAGDRNWTYGHVIIDEAQELSEMAWRMVMRRIPNRWITVVGDVAQTGDPAGASSWQRMLEPYVAKRWKLIGADGQLPNPRRDHGRSPPMCWRRSIRGRPSRARCASPALRHGPCGFPRAGRWRR